MPELKKKSPGFTLIELLISASIFTIIAAVLYSALNTGILGQRNIETSIEVDQMGRQFLERINTDIRNSFAYTVNDTKFSGDGKTIAFLTIVDTFDKDQIRQDFAFIRYNLAGDKMMRLCRKNKDSLNDNADIKPQEIAANIKDISFEFGFIDQLNNELKYKDNWNEPLDNPRIPVAVKIKLTIEDKAAKIKKDFKRTIFLPLAKVK